MLCTHENNEIERKFTSRNCVILLKFARKRDICEGIMHLVTLRQGIPPRPFWPLANHLLAKAKALSYGW